jgi:hypothetical protein
MESIKIGDIVRKIDGRLAPIGCASETDYTKCSCPDEDHCGLRMLMIDVRNAISGILDRYTVSDVVEVTIRKMKRDGVAPPFSDDKLKLVMNSCPGQIPDHPADPDDGFLNWLAEHQPKSNSSKK